MKNSKDVVDKLRQLRVTDNVTQELLARRTGYNRSVIARMEVGGAPNPRINMIIDLADYLGYELVFKPKEPSPP